MKQTRAQRICSLIDDSGLSQSEWARVLNVTRQMVSRWRNQCRYDSAMDYNGLEMCQPQAHTLALVMMSSSPPSVELVREACAVAK